MNKSLLSILTVVMVSFCLACQTEKKDPPKQVTEKEPIQAIDTVKTVPSKPFESISFKASDGLEISADLYHHSDDGPVIVLCHQARSNKEEYKEIALKLQARGYNCLALDQRSGGNLLGVDNETAKRAADQKLGTEYLDAQADVEAGITYAATKYKKPVILLGSSYSASLALMIGAKDENVASIIAFSPGEYFGKKAKVRDALSGLKKPCFITSTKQEAKDIEKMTAGLNLKSVEQFVPETAGIHGAKALWEKAADQKEYWAALDKFLESIK